MFHFPQHSLQQATHSQEWAIQVGSGSRKSPRQALQLQLPGAGKRANLVKNQWVRMELSTQGSRALCTRTASPEVHPQGLAAWQCKALLRPQTASARKHKMHKRKQVDDPVPTKVRPVLEGREPWDNWSGQKTASPLGAELSQAQS